MRIKEIKVFKFSELSEKAKQRAKDDYANNCGFAWGDEYLDSLKALAKHFGGRLTDWTIDFFGGWQSSVQFKMSPLEPIEIRELLEQLGGYNPETLRGLGDCKLTGFVGDEAAIDGFRKAWFDGELDIDALMQAAYNEWLRHAQADCECQYSDETFNETCEANGYEFYANGELA